MFEQGVIPKYLQDHYNGLRNVLASGLPTLRNKTSGHGQGAQPVEVPEYLTASNMRLLMEAHGAKSL